MPTGYVVHHELMIQPERLDAFKAFINADETRAFPGCRSFTVLEDTECPGRILFVQDWVDHDAYVRYQQWRSETGVRAQVRDYYLLPAVTSICRVVQAADR